MPGKSNEPKSRPGDLNPKNTVQSLAKGFRVLQAFTAEEPELKLSEVARRAGLDNGTAFRMLETLVMLGYLERFLETKQYRLTLKPLDLGFNAIARMDLRTIAQPELRTLVGEVREAASVGILDRDEVVYIERYQEGQARLGVDIRVGSRLPAYCTAIGHSILAFLPRAETRRILGLTRRVKVNDHTPVTLEQIEEKLEEARAAGYAISELRIHRRATCVVSSHFRRGRLRHRCPERCCTLPAHVDQGICGSHCRTRDRVSGENRACLVCCRKYGDPVRAKIQQVENLKTRPSHTAAESELKNRLDALKA